MIKHTFEDYWEVLTSTMPTDVTESQIFPSLQKVAKHTWNRALLEAKIVCLNKLGEYKELAFVDVEIVEDISKEIESLKSNN